MTARNTPPAFTITALYSTGSSAVLVTSVPVVYISAFHQPLAITYPAASEAVQPTPPTVGQIWPR